LAYKPNDHYSKKAKSEDFAARSVYKLQEIDEKHHLIHKGIQIMDLGASPGSWSQYCSRKGAKVFAIDLNPLAQEIQGVCFVQADILQENIIEIAESKGFEPHFQGVISDMAPKTTGMRITDQARSFELCQMALITAQKCLKIGGFFIAKMFDSADFDVFRKELMLHFDKVSILRPQSVRKESKELFFIAKGFKKTEE